MAYTKIIPIKTSPKKSIEYITNEKKTNGKLLVSSYNCGIDYAHIDFLSTDTLSKKFKANHERKNENKAYHIIQSFSKIDNLSPILAHEIGKKFIDILLEGKYEYVIATHIDKGHVHNHIIFNATSFYDFKKFKTAPYKTVARMREVSDEQCVKHNLHIIPEKGKKSISYKEWMERNKKTSWKEQLSLELDALILSSTTYDEFKQNAEKYEIEIKEEKSILFRKKGYRHFVKGQTLSKSYTKNEILKRIYSLKTEEHVYVKPKTLKEKLEETKKLSEAFSYMRNEGIHHRKDFEIKIHLIKEKIKVLTQEKIELEHSISSYKEGLKHLLSYQKYRKISLEYDSKPFFLKKKFYNKYESELLAFEYAAKKIQELEIHPSMDQEKLEGLILTTTEKIEDVMKEISSYQSEIKMIEKNQTTIEKVVGKKEEKER